MKIIGMMLVAASFLAGSFLAVIDPREIIWSYMIPVLLTGLTGLWLHRRAHQQEARGGDKLAGNMTMLRSSLANILRNLNELSARGADLPVYEARYEIDRLFRDDLNNFADARESMIHVFGIQNYAEVMSNFAAGERYINRVWSASTDGYVDEVRMYLERAREQFTEGNRHFDELWSQHAADHTVQPTT